MAINPFCRHGSLHHECDVCGKDHKIEVLEAEVERLKGIVDQTVDFLFASANPEFVSFCESSLSDIKAELNKALVDHDRREGK